MIAFLARRAVAVAFAALVSAGASAGGFENAFARGDPFAWCKSTPIGQMSAHDITMCDGTLHFQRAVEKARAEEAAHPMTEYQRCYAALPEFRDGCEAKVEAEDYRDPGAASLCPPPHHMTNDGCK